MSYSNPEVLHSIGLAAFSAVCKFCGCVNFEYKFHDHHHQGLTCEPNIIALYVAGNLLYPVINSTKLLACLLLSNTISSNGENGNRKAQLVMVDFFYYKCILSNTIIANFELNDGKV